jgi:hypothetical protein
MKTIRDVRFQPLLLRIGLCLGLLVIGALACTLSTPTPPTTSVFDSGRTAYGFFPTPPEVNILSVISVYSQMGKHGDVTLLQNAIPWDEFRAGADGKSKAIDDMHGQVNLAWQNKLEPIFVVDPLNGLNRREFANLPADLAGARFDNSVVRAAFQNYALRIVKEFHPRYLGLASEINTYADAFPEDFPNFLSLYQDTYQKIKALSPSTNIFVTFQWEDLNGLDENKDLAHRTIKWNLIEAFEPALDVWAISSYPWIVFPSAKDIPADYYAPLLARTAKPLAVAEGGYPSENVGPIQGSYLDQIHYLRAIHSQLGQRLAFWIYLTLDDFNADSYAAELQKQGHGKDSDALRMFANLGLQRKDGSAKPAMDEWDSYRK